MPPLCPKCNDTLFVQVEAALAPCDCRVGRRRSKLIERWVPAMWRGLRVANLRPSELIDDNFGLSEQLQVIDSLKSEPLGSHSFLGPSGVGKSRFLHCLLQEAILSDQRNIFFSKMAPLVRAIRDNEFKQFPEERWAELLTVDDIKSKASEQAPYFVFIDEFDKVPFTDDVFLRVFELIDFIYEHRELARLSICSNLPVDTFADIWGQSLINRIASISIVHKIGAK